MTIVEINAVNYGSTGTIMLNIAEKAKNNGIDIYCTYPDSRLNRRKKVSNSINIGHVVYNKINRELAYFTGYLDCFSNISTKIALCKISKIKPDIIHLHNLHGSYINLPMLFSYIKKHNIPVVWTLHDCWSFTGQCPHFTMIECDKWKKGCHHCPQYRQYPASNIDRTKNMWKLKKEWFTGVNNMTIVTPSKWLGDLVKESYLKEYNVKVINNGINLSIFNPINSDFREKYNISNEKYVLLGVAFGWGEKKGLDVFIELSERLDKEQYQIILVGTNSQIDKQLPDNIISIHRTQNQKKLAEIYTSADLFVNPTREEVLGLVNIESLACGTPVVTFNSGGSPECIDETCGISVPCDDVDKLEKEIIRICNEKPFSKLNCINKAKSFDMNARFEEYIQLYQKICKKDI